jgi:hypothetical protein
LIDFIGQQFYLRFYPVAKGKSLLADLKVLNPFMIRHGKSDYTLFADNVRVLKKNTSEL